MEVRTLSSPTPPFKLISDPVILYLKNNLSGTINLELDLFSLRTGDTCQIDMVQEKTGNKVTIYCNSMQVVGEVIQDLCRSLSMSFLESTCTFEDDFNQFRDVLLRVERHKQLRERMTADMADMSQSIKSLVIRAEDSRILCDWTVSFNINHFVLQSIFL